MTNSWVNAGSYFIEPIGNSRYFLVFISTKNINYISTICYTFSFKYNLPIEVLCSPNVFLNLKRSPTLYKGKVQDCPSIPYISQDDTFPPSRNLLGSPSLSSSLSFSLLIFSLLLLPPRSKPQFSHHHHVFSFHSTFSLTVARPPSSNSSTHLILLCPKST